MARNPLEANTRNEINTRLQNLGWVLDYKKLDCNVFQEQAKTDEQNKKFKRGRPDYVLYETGTNNPIAIIEAKKPGKTLDSAIDQAAQYAQPIKAPLVFAFNDTFVIAKHVNQGGKPLKIDGEELQDFVDQITAPLQCRDTLRMPPKALDQQSAQHRRSSSLR